jgi:hypothetical protein
LKELMRIKMSTKTTSEMEIYIQNLYDKLKPVAEKDGIYKPIDFCFAETTPHNYPGDFCYSNGEYYYYGSIGDRGEKIINKTSELFDVAYYIFDFLTSVMAFRYEDKHRLPGQPLRSIAFPKQLELMSIIGREYKIKAEHKIKEILKENPYEDDIPLQKPRQKPLNEPTYKLETNGYYYEDGLFSIELMNDILRHFSTNKWDFMTLSPSVPIKGSSFIQVGSPDAKTNYKMAVEIGFPKSNEVELYRYYTENKEEVLQMFKDYYLKQEIPN